MVLNFAFGHMEEKAYRGSVLQNLLASRDPRIFLFLFNFFWDGGRAYTGLRTVKQIWTLGTRILNVPHEVRSFSLILRHLLIDTKI